MRANFALHQIDRFRLKHLNVLLNLKSFQIILLALIDELIYLLKNLIQF
jgi:hypothetical protein